MRWPKILRVWGALNNDCFFPLHRMNTTNLFPYRKSFEKWPFASLETRRFIAMPTTRSTSQFLASWMETACSTRPLPPPSLQCNLFLGYQHTSHRCAICSKTPKVCMDSRGICTVDFGVEWTSYRKTRTAFSMCAKPLSPFWCNLTWSYSYISPKLDCLLCRCYCTACTACIASHSSVHLCAQSVPDRSPFVLLYCMCIL